MNSMIIQLTQELSREKDQNEQLNTKQFITKEQDEVQLNLCIVYNCINRDKIKNIEKIAEEENKVLKEKFEKVMKYNNELQKSIMESMINNMQLNKEIIGLRIQKITLEEERAESKKLVDYLNRNRGPRIKNDGLSKSKKKIKLGHQEGSKVKESTVLEAIKRFS